MSTKTLSTQSKEIVKASAPVLKEHGEKVTRIFYKNMFEAHPELLNIFNETHQRKGDQPQALANTLFAAAVHIDRLEELLPAVKQIAHKHRSLNVKPEHYPIVGKYLLEAMREVLGDSPEVEEVIAAWGEAYGIIADIFISVEEDMYKEAEAPSGGWRGFREFTLYKKKPESSVITSFYLKPADGKDIPPFHPGQYISVQVQPENSQYKQMRQYSLSDAPGKDYLRISVKKEESSGVHPDGTVSNYLHEELQEGDPVLLTAPAGDFMLNERSDRPVVFISGGVGMTPLMSMFNQLTGTGSEREITYLHGAKTPAEHAFHTHLGEEAERMGNVQYAVCYEEGNNKNKDRFVKGTGFIDRTFLEENITHSDADIYLCGPGPFMKAVYGMLKEMGVSENQIHFEFFSPGGTLQ
ncbi:NO-inducible flavohemoprotein [Bacillus sp. H-16]|uniref:NO-inducible flavohemoprotein n=1 Tax=Alteribacter salitolerans TaxID=2912333 RepID=UPI0019640505|nr:NO-inducible flavohemoprotein [Alteribacter salitolerans]MBM7096359.1 NO-inducible flavohemoprotein [Alteribacter salitolerans]